MSILPYVLVFLSYSNHGSGISLCSTPAPSHLTSLLTSPFTYLHIYIHLHLKCFAHLLTFFGPKGAPWMAVTQIMATFETHVACQRTQVSGDFTPGLRSIQKLLLYTFFPLLRGEECLFGSLKQSWTFLVNLFMKKLVREKRSNETV